MLDGHMRHEDSFGNRGDLGPGDVQWMTAAHGIIHSEMPQQTEGRMRGFQLWINLPAREKMKRAAWRDVPAQEIPSAALTGGGEARVIAGTLVQGDAVTRGPIHGLTTEPLYLDLRLPPGATVSIPVASTHNAFLYAYEGEASVGPDGGRLPLHAAGVLSAGDTVRITAHGTGAQLLLLAGRPIGEPIVQYGPFVMNSRGEIEQAIADYQSGRLAANP
jgi:redox-sensitive bicupin YhaK (pirin superfamily)